MTKLAKRHLVNTGFIRIYEGEEDLTQSETSDYFDEKYNRCPSFKNEKLTKIIDNKSNGKVYDELQTNLKKESAVNEKVSMNIDLNKLKTKRQKLLEKID